MPKESHRPITYVIDYEDHLDFADEYVSRIARAPPELLHLGHEVPFNNTWGPLEEKEDHLSLMSPEEVENRIESISSFTEKLHQAGVEVLIPYICNQTIAGHPERRKGIWEFYDHWEDYSDFGFGPKPPDPEKWLAREEYGNPHFNYEIRHKAFVALGMRRYAPCPNNPHYNRYQKGIVENIAKVGYDGVFVDNCILNCYCYHCQSRFKEYIQDNYSARDQFEFFGFQDPMDIQLSTKGNRFHWVKTQPTFRKFLREQFSSEVLKRWLGTEDPDQARIEEGGNGWLWNMADRYLLWMETSYSPEERHRMFGSSEVANWGIMDPKDRALWAETKIFWAKSVARNLKLIRNFGESISSNFFVVPNWGEMQLTDGNKFREEIGHDMGIWQGESDWQMFEESNEPGMIAPGVYLDFILELKFALANGVPGAILSHVSGDQNTVELSHAECLAGLGSFIQRKDLFPDVRSKYRAFHREQSALLEGCHPYYQVGLAYFYDQLHLENLSHMRQVYKFTRYLNDQHVLFSIITEADLVAGNNLPCNVLILPDLRYISDEQVAGLENFLSQGGICFATGQFASHNERGSVREGSLGRLIQSYPDRFIHIQDLGSLIPDDKISLDDARRLARTTWKKINVPGGTGFQSMKHLDEELGIQRYLQGGEMGKTLQGEMSLPLTSPWDALGIRFQGYRKGGNIILHVVNYNLDLLSEDGTRQIDGLDSLEISLPRPHDFAPSKIVSKEPGGPVENVQWSCKKNEVSIGLEDLRFYKLIHMKG